MAGVIQPIHIYFLESNSEFNKELCEFLSEHMREINLMGKIKIIFTIIKPTDDKEFLKKRGIKQLPAIMQQRGPPIIGTPEIIRYLEYKTKTSKSAAPLKTDEEVIRDMQEQNLGVLKRDSSGKYMPSDDQEPDTSFDPSRRMSEELERRRKMGGGLPNEDMRMSPPPPGPSWKPSPEYDDYTPTVQMGRRDAERYAEPQRRADNINDDPIGSLSKLRPENGEQAKDDEMMARLLSNGSSSGF